MHAAVSPYLQNSYYTEASFLDSNYPNKRLFSVNKEIVPTNNVYLHNKIYNALCFLYETVFFPTPHCSHPFIATTDISFSDLASTLHALR